MKISDRNVITFAISKNVFYIISLYYSFVKTITQFKLLLRGPDIAVRYSLKNTAKVPDYSLD